MPIQGEKQQKFKHYKKLLLLAQKAQHCESREKAQKILIKVRKIQKKIRQLEADDE
jgi:hypothetical protein